MSNTSNKTAYAEFLRSPLWQGKRKARLALDHWKCRQCGSEANLDVHHLNYDRPWGQEKMADLLTLCRSCHYQTPHPHREQKQVSTEIVPSGITVSFDDLRFLGDDGVERWSARELMPHFGYQSWRRFRDCIVRATLACAGSGESVTSNFADAVKINKSYHKLEDYHLSRYAAYLVAMEGDPSKPEIARAKTYFAVQTRRAEVALSGREPTILELLEMGVAAEKARLALEAQLTTTKGELAVASQQARELVSVIADIQPDADAWRNLAEADGSYLIENVAKILCNDSRTRVKQSELRRRMYEDWGMLRRDRRDNAAAKQWAIDEGLLVEKASVFNHPDGWSTTRHVVRVTPKGIQWIYQKLGGDWLMEDLFSGEFGH